MATATRYRLKGYQLMKYSNEYKTLLTKQVYQYGSLIIVGWSDVTGRILYWSKGFMEDLTTAIKLKSPPNISTYTSPLMFEAV